MIAAAADSFGAPAQQLGPEPPASADPILTAGSIEARSSTGDAALDEALAKIEAAPTGDLDAMIERGEQVLQVVRMRLDDLGD